MKVSGFTFVRNALKYDYPVVESIRSILPLCDEMIVAVGQSDDGTRELVASIGDPKIRIIDTVWDDTLREGGKVLAVETNKAFDEVSSESHWAFYLQADEVIHEQFHPAIRQAMAQYAGNLRVEGLLFNYTHFWGSYGYIGDSRRWYRREVRIIRNDKTIRSWLDAQGFRKEGRKLNVMQVDASVFHYGWVKPPKAQQAKLQSFHRYWHSDRWMEKSVPQTEAFDYSGMHYLLPFTGTHPAVIQDRVARQDWAFSPDPSGITPGIKETLLYFIEKKTGWRIGEYRNYNVLMG